MNGDVLLSNGPVMADYGGVENVAVVKVPVKHCGARGPGHYPHRSTWLLANVREIKRGAWTYCPGDNAR